MIYLHVLQLIGTNKSQLDQFFDDALGYTNVEEPETFESKLHRPIYLYFPDGVNGIAAKKFLAVPTTQTTSERLFSLSGNIITATRAKLLSQNVEQLSFLYYHLE